MKKALVMILAIIIIVGTTVVDANRVDYSTKAVVVAVDGNEVLVETENGDLWTFEDDNWEINDTLVLYMEDNETEKVTDDEIIDYRMTGF